MNFSLLLIFAATALLTVSQSVAAAVTLQQINELQSLGYQQVESKFRDKSIFKHSTETKTVILEHQEDLRPLYLDELMTKMQPALEERQKRVQLMKSQRENAMLGGNNPYMPDDYWAWIPVNVGSILPGESLSWAGHCFSNNTIKVAMTGATSATMTIHTNLPSRLGCRDFYLFGTIGSWHTHTLEVQGNHVIEWSGFSAIELDDIQRNGFRIFRFYSDETNTIVDVYETMKLFIGALDGLDGTHVPQETADHNLKFLKDYAGLELPPRNITDIPYDQSEIQSGDFIGILRLDGLDPMIAWGAAGSLGHTTVALRMENDTLYVLESQTKSNYWPTNFVQRTPFDTWIKQARDADYNVVHLPLSAEKRAQFNATAAVEYFKTVEGNLYGYQNFIFTFLDTEHQNLPPPVDYELIMILLPIIEPFVDDLLKLSHVPSLWLEALNYRLETTNLTTLELFDVMNKRNLTLGQVWSIPEQDSWTYAGDEPYYPPGHPMVCDVFVCNVWRHAGLFGDMDFNCAEFVPLDVIELNFFDTAPPPQKCLEADPGNLFCQITGKYRLPLPQFNTVTPFPHMREKCPATPPTYADRYNPVAKTSC